MKGQTDTPSSPYGELYVYIVEGVLTDTEESFLGDDFVGNWVEDDMSFLFFSAPADLRLERLLGDNARLRLLESHRFPYEQWQGELDGSLQVDRFRIVLPWTSPESGEGDRVIRLDPGVVFGSGLHPTTRDCLKALGMAHDHQPFHSVLDLGTGTGILGIAAALLGAEKVLAVDVNPLCVKTAVRNVKHNHLEATVRVRQERAEEAAAAPADLLIANIHWDVMKELMVYDTISLFQRSILSGLMRSQVREVKMALENGGAEIIQEWDHEMTWYTLLAVRR